MNTSTFNSEDMDFESRYVDPHYKSEDDASVEYSLRPRTLNEYIGQEKVKENLKVYIDAAKRRLNREWSRLRCK